MVLKQCKVYLNQVLQKKIAQCHSQGVGRVLGEEQEPYIEEVGGRDLHAPDTNEGDDDSGHNSVFKQSQESVRTEEEESELDNENNSHLEENHKSNSSFDSENSDWEFEPDPEFDPELDQVNQNNQEEDPELPLDPPLDSSLKSEGDNEGIAQEPEHRLQLTLRDISALPKFDGVSEGRKDPYSFKIQMKVAWPLFDTFHDPEDNVDWESVWKM